MSYRPHLFIHSIGKMSMTFFRDLIHKHKLGTVQSIEKYSKNNAFIKMKEWNMAKTTSKRLKLQQGKPLLLSDNDNGLWKVYAYEHRIK